MTLHLTGKAVDMKIRKSTTIAARLMEQSDIPNKSPLAFQTYFDSNSVMEERHPDV